MTRKVIVTVATTGAFQGKKANPALPEQPDEIAQAAYECCNAGASIIHIHARDKDGIITNATEKYAEINAAVRAKCDIILQNSTAPAVDWRKVRGPVVDMDEGLLAVAAKPEMCSLDVAMLAVTFENLMVYNTWTRDWIRKAAKLMKENGIKPEFELFSPQGMEDFKNIIVAEKLADPPYSCTFVMGMNKVSQGAMECNPENLMFMRSKMPANCMFSVMGIGSNQVEATNLGLLLGGNVRVGFEDNIYYSRGVLAKSNAQLVERAVRLIREFGYEVASPSEARDILGIPQLSAKK